MFSKFSINRMYKKVLLFIIASVIWSTAQAQAPKYSNEFLMLGVGARGLSMSNTQTATVNDVTSGYWNPAGLSSLSSDYQVSLMHSEYFAGIAKYDYGAFAMKIDTSSAIGFSILRFGVDNIPNTTDLIDNQGNIDYNRISSFSAADYAFLISYAKKSKIQGLEYGANVKIIYRQIGDFAHAWGFGLDIGAQYQYKKWKLGLIAKDITTTFNAWSFNLNDQMKETFLATGNEIPTASTELTLPRLIIGVGRDFNISKSISLLATADVDVTFDGKRNVLIRSNPMSFDPHIGVEIAYKNIVFLRGGIGNIQDEKDMSGHSATTFQPNIGLGVKIKKVLTVDYALTNIGNTSIALYSNVFSLRLDLDKKTR